jgi:hypothetical protein
MRHLFSILSTAVILSVLAPSVGFGQAGSLNGGSPRPDVLLGPANNVSIPAQGSSYIEVTEVRYTRTQFYITYQAILVNSGPALAGVTATLSTQAPSVKLVPGQSSLHFAPVPANNNVISNDTFTILVDRSVPFDFSFLQWSFANPVANPGPNQSATVGSTITLNGSGSTNPTGIGSLTYSWSFKSVPSGSTAVLTNPNSTIASFVVDVPGEYDVTLTVNNGSAKDSATAVISTLSTPPVANAGPNQTVNLGATVRLDGSKSFDTDGNPLTYSWSLISIPATSIATLSNGRSPNPTFVADVPGAFIAQLVVNDGNANSQPSTVIVTTANTAPVANAGPSQRVSVGALVQLDGSGSTDVNGNPLTYLWSLNTSGAPGSTATLSNPNSVKPTFTLDVPGIYVAQLIVNDGVLNSSPSTVTITSNTVQPPTANAGNNQVVVPGATVTLNGLGSTDAQGLPLTYAWSLMTKPAGSTAVLSATNVPTPTFVADRPGTYIAQLTVFDGILYSTPPATVTITSTNAAPTANAGPNQSVTVGATVTLDASQSSDPNNEPLTYSWSFLNIPAASAATLSGVTTKNPSFVADVAGTYVAQLIVTDLFSSSNPATVTITAGVNTITLSPSPLNLVNTPQTLTVTLSPGAGPNPVVVGFSGFDTNVITLASSTVTVPANSTGANVTVTPKGPGSTRIIANAGGYTPTSDVVNVTTAAISIALNNNATAVGLTRTLSGTITLSAPAPPAGLTVALSADPSAQGQVTFSPTSVSIPGGGTSGTFSVTGTVAGPTTLTASGAGYTSGTDSILVVQLGGIAVSQGVTVAPGQSTALGVQLSTPAPVGGVTITLTSSDTNLLTVSPSVFIAAGSTTPATPAQVTGVAIGSPTVKAEAGGYTSDTETVKVAATITLSPATLAVAPGGTQTLNIILSSPAPAGGLPVTLNSNNTAAATVQQSLTINGTSGSVQVTGVAAGQATITVSTTNQLFSVVGSGVVVTVTTLPVVTCPAVTSGEVGVAFNIGPLTVTGGTSPYTFSIASGGSLPAGLTLNTSTGAITGTPTASGSFTLQVKDANGVAAAVACPFTIASALTMTCPAVTTGQVGVAFSSGAPAINGGIGPFTFSIASGSLPAGLTLNTTTGAITGTPTASGAFTLQLKDSMGATAATTCPFNIGNALTLTCPSVTSGEVGVPFNSTPTVSGGTAPYTFSIASGGSLPAGLALNATTGAITGTPTAAGSFTLQVKDSGGAIATTTCPFTIATAPTLTCPAVTTGAVGVAFNSPAPNVTGGVAPFTFSVTGTLPAGLTLNTSNGAITGTPTVAGQFTLQVKDSNGVTAATTCPYTITLGLAVSCPSVTSGEVGVAFSSGAPTVTGGTGPFTFSVNGTLPAGLTLNTTTGAITGTPTASGTFSLQVKDSLGATANTCSYTIVAPPTLACPSVVSGEVGVPFNSGLPTASGGVAPYTFAVIGTLPAGLTLNTTSGAITGTPTASGQFTLQVKDSNGVTATGTCAFNIAFGPTMTCPAVTSGEVGVAFNSLAPNVSGGTTPYTFSVIGTLPSGLTLNTSNGVISGTPTAAGTFNLQVKDAAGATAATPCPFTIALPPSLACSAVTSGEVGVAFNSGAATASNGVGPYTFSTTAPLPAGLTLNTSNGVISGTPTAAGTITLQVKDANGVVAASSCSITIVPGPTITCPATTSFTQGSPVNSPVIAVSNGVAPYTFSLSSGSLPAGLTLNTSNGAITGTPTATGSFTVVAKDANGQTSNGCSFTVGNGVLKINTTALPPGTQNVLYSFQPQFTGGKGPFTWTITGLPRGLNYDASTGLISGTPGFGGTASVTLSITDSSSPAQTASAGPFSLLITTSQLAFVTSATLPNAPLTTPPTPYSVQIVATGGTLPYNWSANTTDPSYPTWLTFDVSGQGACGTPVTFCGNPPALGNFSFTVTVIDSSSPAQSVSRTFTGIVTPPTGVGTIAVSNATVGQGLEVSIPITFTPVPTASAVQCPQGPATPGCLTLTSSNPSLILLGQAGAAGSASVTAPIPAGTTTVSVFVQAVGTAPAGTTATVTASFAGYNNGVATITYANSGFVISGPSGIGANFNTFQGVQSPLTVFAARLDSTGLFVEQEDVAAGTTLSVPIASSNPSIGTVSPTLLSFTGGTSSVPVTFAASGQNMGSTSLTVTQPNGFTTPVVGGTISANVQTSGLIAPSGVVIGKNLEVTTNVSTTGNATQALAVTLSSNDPTRLLFACPPQGGTPQCTPATGASAASITVNIPQNSSQSANFIMRGYDSTGTITYSLSAPGKGTNTGSVTLAPSGFMIQTPGGGFGGFTISQGNNLGATLNVFTAALPASGFVLEALGGDQPPLSVAVTSDSTNVGTITTSPVTIAGGASSASTTFQPGASKGSANITASAGGYTSATVTATVVGNTLSVNNLLIIGQHLEGNASVFLSTPAPSGGLPVTISVDTASVGRLALAVNATDAGSNTIVVTVPQGQQVGTYWVYALGSTGTATYSASAPNYGFGQDTTTLAPSAVIILGPSNQPGSTTVASNAGPQTVTVLTDMLSTDGQNTPQPGGIQPLAGNTPLSVLLSNSNTTAGKLSAASVSIPAGSSSGTVTYTPAATGNSVISVTEPNGYTTPGLFNGSLNLTQFTFQVTP